jgi:hypothetical protein
LRIAEIVTLVYFDASSGKVCSPRRSPTRYLDAAGRRSATILPLTWTMLAMHIRKPVDARGLITAVARLAGRIV